MSKPKLNKDEKEILKDFEAGEFESVLTPRRKKYTRHQLKKLSKKTNVLILEFQAVI